MDKDRCKLAIIATHPIQYYAPWFADIASHPGIDLRVFYLLEPRDAGLYDRGFQRMVKWDIGLLDGYASEFVPNESRDPGTHHFGGLRNPRLAERVRGFGPDAVLLTAYNFDALVRFILSWRRRTPLLFRGDSHRIVAQGPVRGRIKRWLIAALFRRIDAFLYVGEANRRYFRMHGVPDRALFHSPHAVDNARFCEDAARDREEALAWRATLGIPASDAVILFAGKLEPKKQPLALLEAFRTLQPRGASLLFVGNGPLEDALRLQAQGVPHVHLAPFQNQGAMPRTYAACDVLVLPSVGPSETWGLAVNEAMAAGKPAIVSHHVGCAEDLVLPRLTGLVFEAGNVAALRDALATALEDRERLRGWGEEARRRIRHYSHARATAGLLLALSSLGLARE